MQLKGRVAIITGAGAGLGREVAKTFVREGSHVVIISRTSSTTAETCEQLERLATPAQSIMQFTADVTDEPAIQSIVAKCLDQFTTVHTLVNCAGVYGPMNLLEETSVEDFRRALDINLMGTLIPIKALIPHFKTNNYGKVINLSGGGATKPMPRLSCYAASKSAVVRFTETIAQEVADYQIDINAIAPGALNTKMLDEVLAAGSTKVGDQFYQNALKQKDNGGVPLDKACALITYLASQQSDGISGRLLSALWDNWKTLSTKSDTLKASDVYTLRRITASERGFTWDDILDPR